MKAFSILQTGNRELQDVQQTVAQTLKPILQSLIIDGLLLQGITLEAGQDNLINHKLGRALQFWILAGQNANSTVWEKTSPLPSKTLNLWCSSDCTINLWVG